jgi:predicted lipoprotein
MRVNIISLLIVSIVIPAFLISCGDDDLTNQDNFDRGEMLENIASNIILPAFDQFESATSELESTITTLTGDVNQANLDVVQDAWLNTIVTWKYAEMFVFGPVDQMVAAPAIDNWRADNVTNTLGIEEVIDTNQEINASYIQSIGATRKGLPAIEYLLFDFEGGDQAILDQLNTSENRRAYLLALSARLNQIATAVNQAWKPGGGNYIETFTGSTGKSAASSVNVLANEFLMLIERVKNHKLGIPLGKRSMGTLLPENVEARFSGESLVLMQRNIDAIEDVFLGTGASGDQQGYADYLNALNAEYNGQPLADVIANQIEDLRASVNAINDPLKTALEIQNAQVEEAYNAAQRLVVFTKTDMMSNLGLLVTYTDNDGD